MQTFLPYPNFDLSAQILDRARLGKQRVENLQILMSLLSDTGLRGGWSRHPAAKMWKTYEVALFAYQDAICKEWASRGYKDTCLMKSWSLLSKEQQESYKKGDYLLPEWFGNKDFHQTHRSNLKRKDPIYYTSFFPLVSPDIPYIWPAPANIEN